MKKEFVGVVLSKNMSKTSVVSVERLVRHPLYRKVLKVRKKFYIHDENDLSKTGDVVSFCEVRPISKLKRWSLLEVLEKSKL